MLFISRIDKAKVEKETERNIFLKEEIDRVGRIVKIPNTQKAFGVEIMMSENETENNHPKVCSIT